MIDFTLLVPTCMRPVELQRMLHSIRDTVAVKENIEILLGVDENDDVSKLYLPGILEETKDLNVKVFYRTKSEFINRDYYNWLAEFATGNYLWVSADDLKYCVEKWDIKIKSYIEGYLSDKPDRIACFGVKDNTPKPNNKLPPFPCFPLITKEAFKHLGFVLHPFIPTWGADYLVYLLYTGVNRYMIVEDDIYINHISYHTRQCVSDATNINVGNIFNRLKMRPEYNVDNHAVNTIPNQIDELRNYISNYRSS